MTGTGGWWDDVTGALPPGNDVANARSISGLLPSGEEQCATIPGTGMLLPPRGPNIAESAITRLIFPPRLEKLAASVDFHAQDFNMTLAAVAGATVSSVALSFTLPTGQVGWLQEFSLWLLTPTALTSASWQVRINDAPVPGFDNVQNPPGIANLIYITTDDMRVRLPNAARIDIVITNVNGNGPWTVGGDLAGWYHPEIAERRAWNLDV